MIRSACALFAICNLVTIAAAVESVPIIDIPDFDNAASINVYYLEGAFPFNAPASIIAAAGSAFSTYSATVSGLGIWNTITDEKLSIQFVSNNYVGGLLPNLTSGDTVTWNNKGMLLGLYDFDEDLWGKSQLLVTTTGGVINDLLGYLRSEDTESLFNAYQPISVVLPTESLLDNYTASSTSILYTYGSTQAITHVVDCTSSYTFVYYAIDRLAAIGCDLKTFLPVFATSFTYLAVTSEYEIVTINKQNQASTDVYDWYKNLTDCIQACYATAIDAPDFANSIQACYAVSAHAYVYYDDSSVYKVKLYNSTVIPTPIIYRYDIDLPTGTFNVTTGLSAIDYFLLALVFLVFVLGLVYFTRSILYYKNKHATRARANRLSTEEETVNIIRSNDEERQTNSGNMYKKHSLLSWFSLSSSNSNSNIIK